MTKKSTTKPESEIRFLFDTETRRPACVLIQAIYGGDRRACEMFRHWQVDMVKSFVWLSGTEDEVRKFADKVNGESSR
jgi:hypothetical protein